MDGSTTAADEDPVLLARLKEPADNAEQPVERTTASAPDSSSLPDSSAARPAAKVGGPAELLNLTECKNWLQALPSQEILQNKSLQRLQEVLDLLQTPSSRQQRQKIHKLLGNWDVRTKTQGRKRKYDEIKVDLVAKIVEEARRLKRMRHEFEEPCSRRHPRDYGRFCLG